jgi:hypothetical protein
VVQNGTLTVTQSPVVIRTALSTPSIASSASASSSGSNTVLITPLDFTLQVISSPTVEGIYGTTRQYTLHIAPIGGTFPGDVQFTTKAIPMMV